MPETYDVTFRKQTVYHDGKSMIVAKEGETRPLDQSRVLRMVEEGSIDEPEGWSRTGALGGIPRADGFQTQATGTFQPADDSAFDHDHDGHAGGSLPADPPALSGKNKAQLREIAAAEGVEVAEDATNAEIVAAIEAARGDADAPPA